MLIRVSKPNQRSCLKRSSDLWFGFETLIYVLPVEFCSQNMHSTYTKLLEKNAVNLSAPLDDFDKAQVEIKAKVDQANGGDDEVEEIEEAEYDARLGRTGNYMETKGACLIQAWESVSLDAMIDKNQSFGSYWQKIEDKYLQILSFPPIGH